MTGDELGLVARWRRRIVAAPEVLLRRGLEAYNRRVTGLKRLVDPSLPADEREILMLAQAPTDISRHLPTLFRAALDPPPSLIVELGIRGGGSTFVFERAARRSGATLVSVDIEDCSGVTDWDRWLFVREDDLAFARRFPVWCADRGLDAAIDVLFIDTSHAYDHTLAELRAWMPFLVSGGRAILHDSNMGGVYRRGDWTIGFAAHMDRGVARAIQDWLGASFDERRPFSGRLGGFDVVHDPLCCGLTVLRRPVS